MKKFAIAVGIVACALAVVAGVALAALVYIGHEARSQVRADAVASPAAWRDEARNLDPNIAFSGMIQSAQGDIIMFFYGKTKQNWDMCNAGEFSALESVGVGTSAVKGCWTFLKDQANDAVTVRWADGTSQSWPLHQVPNVVANDYYKL